MSTKSGLATQAWRSRAESLISFAESASAYGADFAALGVQEESDRSEELQEQVTALLNESDASIGTAVQTEAETAASSLPILLGNLEAATALIEATAASAGDLAPMGLEDGGLNFDEARVRIAVFAAAADGEVERPDHHLSEALHERLDELQNTGAQELVDLATSPTVASALIGGVKAISVVVGAKATEAFEQVRKAVTWIQAQATRIIEWVLKKLRDFIPEDLRDDFDNFVEKTKDKIVEGLPDQVGKVLGALLGRDAATAAWSKLPQKRVMELEPELTTVTSGQITRIGHISTARTTVDKFAIIATSVSAADLVPYARAAVLAVITGVFGFVAYQVYDGFHAIERIAVQ